MMGSSIRSGVALVLALLLAACSSSDLPESPQYGAFDQNQPRSILIVPIVNETTAVDAPDGLLVTLAIPLAERGFYVFPTHMVRRTMQDEGLGDADLLRSADPERIAGLFGADAILFATVREWDARYSVFSTTTIVAIDYELVSGKTGGTLWRNSQRRVYTAGPQGNGGLGDLIGGAIAAAVERASPTYMTLARQATTSALTMSGRSLPYGPYYQPPR